MSASASRLALLAILGSAVIALSACSDIFGVSSDEAGATGSPFTQGLATAQVIRMTAPYAEAFGGRHHHELQFQMAYVLKGWFKAEFEGQGPQLMRAGSCWIQPPGIRHRVLGWSDDCELLEIILPAEHQTVNDD